MKRIGMTDAHQMADEAPQIIVHMSQEEWGAFASLEAAVADEYPDDFWHPSTGTGRGADLASVFEAITLWCQLRFKTTALKRQINYIIEELENRELE